MNILLICMIPLSFVLGGFLTWKSLQLGLRWNMQLSEKKEPTLQTPIEKVVETVQENKAFKIEQHNKDIMNEWMFGGN